MLVWAGLCGSTLLVAVAVAVMPGLGRHARAVLGLSFDPPAARFGDVAGIWLHNLCALSPALAGPAVVRLLRRGRRVLLVLVAGQAAVGVLSVGGALGGYGPPLLPWLVHVPVEWMALAVALQAFRSSRNNLSGWLPRSLAAVCLLLGAAALLEVYATPHQ
jgi:hypothetical protein